MICDLRVLRQSAGFSQAKLAQESGVSLPTIQNIEASKTNPTVEILSKILNSLGLQLTVSVPSFDLDMAIRLGVPLSGNRSSLKAHRMLLIQELRKWKQQLIDNLLVEREKETVLAFLLALKDHYPSLYAQFTFPIKIEKELQQVRSQGRLIKLRRIAIANLAGYL